ncbi:MAG: sensor histidine kinase, partial [Lentisphaeria bacterium]
RIMVMESKSEALKDLNMAAAGIVHETKNPLNLIRGLSQMLTLEQGSESKVRSVARNIVEEVDIVTSRLNQFLAYSKPRQSNVEVFCFRSLVEELFEILKYDLEDKDITFYCEAKDTKVEGDRDMLRQILFNLLINSIKAISTSTKNGEVKVQLIENNEQNTAEILVKDNGSGITPDVAKDIFRPYFTTNESGTGLGLSIVRQLASANNWQIDLLTDSLETTFVISQIKIKA